MAKLKISELFDNFLEIKMAKLKISELFDNFLEIKGGIESASIQEIYQEFKDWAEKEHSVLIGSYMSFYINAIKKSSWQKIKTKKNITEKYQSLDGLIRTIKKTITFYSFSK